MLTIFLWFTFLYFYILVIVIIQNNYIHLDLYLFSIFETKQWQSQRGKRALYIGLIFFFFSSIYISISRTCVIFNEYAIDILILLRDKQTTRRGEPRLPITRFSFHNILIMTKRGCFIEHKTI